MQISRRTLAATTLSISGVPSDAYNLKYLQENIAQEKKLSTVPPSKVKTVAENHATVDILTQESKVGI